MELSRRAFGGIALGAMSAACTSRSDEHAESTAANAAAFRGVGLGVCVGSYKDIARSGDQLVYMAALADACAQSGAGLVEYHSSQLEPATRLYARAPRGEPPLPDLSPDEFEMLRNERRQWRLETPPEYFGKVREIFESAGTTPFCYSFNFTDDVTDAEIESVFVATRALGATVISTNGAKVSMAPRLAPFAERHGISIGMHNHSRADDPAEVGSRESFEHMFETSPYCKANLDIGHFTAGNQDPIAFIEDYHDKITHLHFKDRSPNRGPNVPWGMGKTPLREVLQLIQKNKYPIPCLVEYEYYGYPGTGGSIEENKKCLEFMKEALA